MTFFVDRDLGPRVGRALREVKVDVVLHAERFAPREADKVWLTAVSKEQQVILTRDRHIRGRPAERKAFEEAGARCFVVTTGVSTPLEDLRALLIAWPLIRQRVAEMPAPFMYGVSKEGRLTQYIPTTGPAGPAARAKTAGKGRRRTKGLAEPA